jgi:hypothetical protein
MMHVRMLMRRLDASLPEPARRVPFVLVLLVATVLSYRTRKASKAQAERYIRRELKPGATLDDILRFLVRHRWEQYAHMNEAEHVVFVQLPFQQRFPIPRQDRLIWFRLDADNRFAGAEVKTDFTYP